MPWPETGDCKPFFTAYPGFGMTSSEEKPRRPPAPQVSISSATDSIDGGVISAVRFHDDDAASIGSGELREKWQMVVNEVISTEQAYVEALDGVITWYMDAINPYLPALELDAHDLSILFSNIKELMDLNSDLLSDLMDCDCDPVKLCACFVKRKESFNRYTDYCTNFPRSVAKLEGLLKRRGSPASEFFKGCQRKAGHKLPLGSQLIKPVQRILKYHLLMRELLKTSKGHVSESDVQTIEEAGEVMQGVATHINEMKRQNERTLYVQELQSRLTGWEGDELSSYGDLLFEGVLRIPKKLFGHSDRKAYLFEKLFLLTKEKEENAFQVKDTFKVNDLGVVEMDDDAGRCPQFRVSQVSLIANSMTFQAQDDDDKRIWVDTLRRAVVASDERLSEETKHQLLAAIVKDNDERTSSAFNRFGPGNRSESRRNKSKLSPKTWRRATVAGPPVTEHATCVKTESVTSERSASVSGPPARPPPPPAARDPSPKRIETTYNTVDASSTASPGLRERLSQIFHRDPIISPSKEPTDSKQDADGNKQSAGLASPRGVNRMFSREAMVGEDDIDGPGEDDLDDPVQVFSKDSADEEGSKVTGLRKRIQRYAVRKKKSLHGNSRSAGAAAATSGAESAECRDEEKMSASRSPSPSLKRVVVVMVAVFAAVMAYIMEAITVTDAVLGLSLLAIGGLAAVFYQYRTSSSRSSSPASSPSSSVDSKPSGSKLKAT